MRNTRPFLVISITLIICAAIFWKFERDNRELIREAERNAKFWDDAMQSRIEMQRIGIESEKQHKRFLHDLAQQDKLRKAGATPAEIREFARTQEETRRQEDILDELRKLNSR